MTLICWLFIVVGYGSFLRGLEPLVRSATSTQPASLTSHDFADAAWVVGTALAALLAGAFMLSEHFWVLSLAVSWMVFHIALSLLHDMTELLVHCLLFGMIFYILFRPASSAY